MKKFNLILIALIAILLSSVVFAESTENDSDEVDVTDEAVLAESEQVVISEAEASDKAYIRTLFFSGTGITANKTDSMDFFIVKVVGAKVALADKNIVGKGILVLDDKKYRLTDLVVEGDTATAKIVSPESSVSADGVVGSLELTKIAKPLVDVWAGTMVLDSVEYNFYLIVHKRQFKAEESAEKAKNYCYTHPYDEDCKSVAGYLCKENTEECREKVASYCGDHPDDSRCKNIIRSFCAGNLKDERCRTEIKEYCEENPEADYCNSEAVDFCKENPEDEKCTEVFSDYCSKNPRDLNCKPEALRYCKENPSTENCAPIIKQFCEYSPSADLCGEVKIDFCEENPDSPKCLATATALCKLNKYVDTEKCSQVISNAKERVREAVQATNKEAVKQKTTAGTVNE